MPDEGRPRRAVRRPLRRRSSQLVVGGLVALLAFAVTVQVRQDDTTDYGSLRGVELIELLKSVDVANERLAAQIDDLTATRDRLRASKGDAGEAEDVARKRAAELAVLAGSVGATGPGVRLTVTDPSGAVDAGLVLEVLQELRQGGAEAIVVNDVARVVAQTYVLDDEKGLRIGGRQVTSPYRFDVIGDPSTLEEAVRFRSGVADLVKARGAKVSLTRRATVTITALADVRTPEYARPDVGSSGSD